MWLLVADLCLFGPAHPWSLGKRRQQSRQAARSTRQMVRERERGEGRSEGRGGDGENAEKR